MSREQPDRGFTQDVIDGSKSHPNLGLTGRTSGRVIPWKRTEGKEGTEWTGTRVTVKDPKRRIHLLSV